MAAIYSEGTKGSGAILVRHDYCVGVEQRQAGCDGRVVERREEADTAGGQGKAEAASGAAANLVAAATQTAGL